MKFAICTVVLLGLALLPMFAATPPKANATVSALSAILRENIESVEITETISGEDARGLGRLVESAIRVEFNYKTAVIHQLTLEATGQKVTLFIFDCPTALRRSFQSVERLALEGMLVTKAPHWYYAIGTREQLLIVVQEQKSLSTDSEPLKSLLPLLEKALPKKARVR